MHRPRGETPGAFCVRAAGFSPNNNRQAMNEQEAARADHETMMTYREDAVLLMRARPRAFPPPP